MIGKQTVRVHIGVHGGVRPLYKQSAISHIAMIITLPNFTLVAIQRQVIGGVHTLHITQYLTISQGLVIVDSVTCEGHTICVDDLRTV